MKILVMQPLPPSSITFLREKGTEPLFAYENDDWRSVAEEIRALTYYSVRIDKPPLDAHSGETRHLFRTKRDTQSGVMRRGAPKGGRVSCDL